jgi:hypothetical protein
VELNVADQQQKRAVTCGVTDASDLSRSVHEGMV